MRERAVEREVGDDALSSTISKTEKKKREIKKIRFFERDGGTLLRLFLIQF